MHRISMQRCMSSESTDTADFETTEEDPLNASTERGDDDDYDGNTAGKGKPQGRKKRKKKKDIDFTPSWQRETLANASGAASTYKILRQKQHQRYWDEIWNKNFQEEEEIEDSAGSDENNNAAVIESNRGSFSNTHYDEIEVFLDHMLESKDSCTQERIGQAVAAIRNRAALASDFFSPKVVSRPTSLGPLTMVLPKFRDNLLLEEWETRALLNLLFGVAVEIETGTTDVGEKSENFDTGNEWCYTRGELADELIEIKEAIKASVKRQRDERTMDEILSNLMQKPDKSKVTDPNAPKASEKKGVHFRMETDSAGKQNVAMIEPPPFLILVENLPIDVTPEEVDQWYGRCGSISSLSIHNQRPELDPGPLTPAQIKARRKQPWLQQRFRNKIHRPRSPVYALVEFADRDGYEQAIGHALTVFGMVVRRHDARSVPASRLKTLYIEHLDAPDSEGDSHHRTVSWSGLAIEQELQEALDPIWVYLSSSGNSPRSKRLASSCQVQFESFEMAWHAYLTLKSSNAPFEHLHWLPSPEDAEKWWTRERGFE